MILVKSFPVDSLGLFWAMLYFWPKKDTMLSTLISKDDSKTWRPKLKNKEPWWRSKQTNPNLSPWNTPTVSAHCCSKATSVVDMRMTDRRRWSHYRWRTLVAFREKSECVNLVNKIYHTGPTTKPKSNYEHPHHNECVDGESSCPPS